MQVESLICKVSCDRFHLARGALADEQLVREDLLRNLDRTRLFSARGLLLISTSIERFEFCLRRFDRLNCPLLGFFGYLKKSFLDQVEVFLNVTWQCLLLEPTEDLRSSKDLEFVWVL